MVLVDCAGGGELGAVHDILVHSLGSPAVLLRREDLGRAAVTVDLDTGLLTADGRCVRPAVVWARHSSAPAIVTQADPAGSVTMLEGASWSAFIAHLTAAAEVAFPGESPVGTLQLRKARKSGVQTPKTIITNDLRGAGKRREIIKTPDFRLFEPDRGKWREHAPVMAGGHRAAGGRPVVVQEYVPHSRELRVYHLDGGLCAFEVAMPGPAAMWTDPAAVTVTPVECPAAVAAAVRTLAAAWGLRYGAFDMLVRPSGEPVFLEANPDGDWLWYERRSGWHGVSFMAAVMVHESFLRAGESVAA